MCSMLNYQSSIDENTLEIKSTAIKHYIASQNSLVRAS